MYVYALLSISVFTWNINKYMYWFSSFPALSHNIIEPTCVLTNVSSHPDTPTISEVPVLLYAVLAIDRLENER